jgi:WD40 repeat protein
MMRNFAVMFLMLFGVALAAAYDNVAQLQLPCESRHQELSPTGTQLAVSCKDHSLRLVSIPDGKQSSLDLASGLQAESLAYSPDGRWLAIGFNDGSVQINPTQGNASVRSWKASSHRIADVYFLPDAKTLLVMPIDTPGQIWELADKPALRATLPVDFGGISAYAASPDGKTLVIAGDDTVIDWYDTATWKNTREDRSFLLETFALRFTPDGKQLLVGGANARVIVVDAASGKRVREMPSEDGSSAADIEMLGDRERAATLYFDNAGDKPPHGVIWDLSTAKSVPIKTTSTPTCGEVVGGKLWLCNTDGRTLTISQYN